MFLTRWVWRSAVARDAAKGTVAVSVVGQLVEASVRPLEFRCPAAGSLPQGGLDESLGPTLSGAGMR